MADYNSSLPVRTENNGDVAAKIVDGTITSQALGVDASGRITTKMQDGAGNAVTSQANGAQRALDVGIDVAGVQIDPRQIRALTSADTVTVVQPTAANLHAQVDIRDGAGNSLTSATAGATRPLDVALRDGSGNLYTTANPVPVVISQNNPGAEINNYNTAAAIAAGGTSNHDYTVTAATTLLLTQIEASGSGKMKIEVQVETGVASGVFQTRFVQFSSTANPNMSIKLAGPITVAAGVRVRVIRTNRDSQAQDVYSTICGQEV